MPDDAFERGEMEGPDLRLRSGDDEGVAHKIHGATPRVGVFGTFP